MGETLEAACVKMLQLERAAKMILLAAPLGKVKPCPREAVEKFESLVESDNPNRAARSPNGDITSGW